MAKALQEGRAEGAKAKALAAVEILLSKNIATDIISEETGLTPEEIAELQENGRV